VTIPFIFKSAAQCVTAVRLIPPDGYVFLRGRAHLPVLTLDGYAAMPLHMKAYAAVSKQYRIDFASDERLGGGGATSISNKTASGGGSLGGSGPWILHGSRGLDLTCHWDVRVSRLMEQSMCDA